MYPAFVNCATIDWFSEWPHDALLEVAEKYLTEVQFLTEAEVCAHCVHYCYVMYCKELPMTMT